MEGTPCRHTCRHIGRKLGIRHRSTIQAVWVTEAKKRRDEIRDGSVQPIPGDEALAQVRRLLEP
ncbi:addiction module protein [Trichothermofontia sichuanensis]|uniref:addiction module protein n=1 Tax=Trichothermofontia sichuanensis TaxID=3045816 RepID=UPI0036F33565